MTNFPDYRDPQAAFEAALAAGRLSHDRKAPNYVADDCRFVP